MITQSPPPVYPQYPPQPIYQPPLLCPPNYQTISQLLSSNDIPICINNSANATNNNGSFNGQRRRRNRSYSPGRGSSGRGRERKEEGHFQSFEGPSIRLNFTREGPGGGLFGGKGKRDSLGFLIGAGGGNMGCGRRKVKRFEELD